MNRGDRIQDRYELMNKLGKGGMGQVWSARDVRLERTVALKVISPGLAEDPEFLVRFLREAQSIARIAHPNVVNILDFGETAGSPFLVMEYVPGQSVAEMTGAPMEPERAREIAAQAAAGAGAAHEQDIVHRDIKPGNILMTSDGRAKLVDFGIASAMGAERITVTGQTIGSPHYISPEQATGDLATPASDVYSLGVVLFELLSGVRPFEGNSVAEVAAAHIEQNPPPLHQVVVGVDAGLEAVVMKCLAKNPADRYPNGAALAAALREGGAPPPPPPAAMAGTAVMRAMGGDTAMLDVTDFQNRDMSAPPRDSVAKAILIGLGIGLLLLAIFVGVLLLIRNNSSNAQESGGGGGPAPANSEPAVEPAASPATNPDQPVEQPQVDQPSTNPPAGQPPASPPSGGGSTPGNPGGASPPSGGGGGSPRPPGGGGGGNPSP